MSLFSLSWFLDHHGSPLDAASIQGLDSTIARAELVHFKLGNRNQARGSMTEFEEMAFAWLDNCALVSCNDREDDSEPSPDAESRGLPSKSPSERMKPTALGALL